MECVNILQQSAKLELVQSTVCIYLTLLLKEKFSAASLSRVYVYQVKSTQREWILSELNERDLRQAEQQAFVLSIL